MQEGCRYYMLKQSAKRRIFNYISITVGACLYAAGISMFLDPNNLAPGGITGISVILNRLIHVETGTLYFLCNVPIMLLGWWKFGWRFIVSTAYAVVLTSTATNLLSGFPAITQEPLLAAIAGSILTAVGIGIIFRAGATTGGMDIIIKILRLKYKHMKTGSLFLMTDMCVVAASGLVFRDFNIMMYALIAVIITGRVLDAVLYGTDEAKLIYIISDYQAEITKCLLEDLDIGVTYLEGTGGYSNKGKRVIMCVAKKQSAPQIEEIVKQKDPAAFMIITSANEIYGEGYKDIFSEKL